jgi:hypothetical protein
MNAFQAEYAVKIANRHVYSIPCADHVLNLVRQAILKKLNATANKSEIQDLAENTYKVNTEEAESELRDSATSYAQANKRRKTTSTYKKRRTNVAPEGLNTWAKIRWITGKLHQQQHLIRSLQRNITRLTGDGTGRTMIRPTIDVPTRWNSFYYMLRNFSQSRLAIEAVMRRYIRDFTNLELSQPDWLIINELRKALGEIEVLSDFFQASRGYPTLSSVLPMISRLYTVLDELVEGTTYSSLKLAYKDGLEKLEKYFPRRADLSDRAIQAHVIATILDPRFKLYVLRGPNWSETRLARAKNLLISEYSYYDRLYKKLHPEEEVVEASSQNSRLAQLQEEIYGASEEETNEITRYLAEPRGARNTDILDWWKHANYTALKIMAQNYLGILASSAAIEGFFSQVADVANPRKRNRLTKRRINELACLKSWNKVLYTLKEGDISESDDSDFPASIQDNQSESSDEEEVSD